MQANLLHAAAQAGDVTRTEALLAANGTKALHERDSDGRTPLLLAAREGHVDMLRVLLRAGADVDAVDTTWGE